MDELFKKVGLSMNKRCVLAFLCAGMLFLTACGTTGANMNTDPEWVGTSAPMAAAPGNSGFSDVASDAWYAEAVMWCRANELMNGTSDTEFSPDITMTRAMLATVLHRVAGTPVVGETAPFSDVVPNIWYSDAVAWASANEIVGGYGGGVFGVDDPVTHEQIVTILWRYDGSKTMDSELSFADASAISGYATEAVRWAAANGIIADWASDKFEPAAGTTRAQVAAMFYRYLSDKEAPSTGNLEGVDVSKLEHITTSSDAPVVYMTTDIGPEGLAAVYEALNWTPTGNVAVKLSTGEAGNTHYLSPDLIKDLVQQVNGTIVECNTAYGGSRASTAMHRQVAEDHGFTAIADVDIMDADGWIEIPVANGKHLTVDRVGQNFANYDSVLVLSHFKGHSMGGFGGAIKNISIGIASSSGKMLIHSGGHSTSSWGGGTQDDFLESMAEAAKAVSDYMDDGDKMVYISVMNHLSVDCDCDGNPAAPDMHDIGILASIDPVALDQACVDLVYAVEDGASLIQRIESRNGLLTLAHAEALGLGSRSYQLVGVGG